MEIVSGEAAVRRNTVAFQLVLLRMTETVHQDDSLGYAGSAWVRWEDGR